MKEQLLKRKLNPFLLITTVLVLAILAGLSVVYQVNLEEKVNTTQRLQGEVSRMEERIELLTAKRNNLSAELNTTEEELAEVRNTSLTRAGRIERLQSQRESLDQRISDLQENLGELNNTVEELNETVDGLNFSLAVICESNSTLSGTAEDQCEVRGH